MPTQKPRIYVTLEPSRYRILKAFADRHGVPLGQVIGSMVETIAPLLAAELAQDEQPALFPEAVMVEIRAALAQEEGPEAVRRLGKAIEALGVAQARVLTTGLLDDILSGRRRGGPGGPPGGPAGGPSPAPPPPSRGKRPPYGNHGGHKRVSRQSSPKRKG